MSLHEDHEPRHGPSSVTSSDIEVSCAICGQKIERLPNFQAAMSRDGVDRRTLVSTSRPSFRLFCGDALEVLKGLPAASVDMCITSPPYWGHREYDAEGIGLEPTYVGYVANLCRIFAELKRVLKPAGSLWLNIGDAYEDKHLVGVPWRVAIRLIDEQGWILRNDVIWNKVKGAPDNSRDKLRNVYEHVFHFVRQKQYYYHVDAIRSKPRESAVVNGSVISATGVSGIRYRRQIELSTNLSACEKIQALRALDAVLEDMKSKRISDFRMIIRGQQRTTHSNSARVSGRAKELQQKGFYFLKYHPNGTKPSDVWDILPEDTQRRDSHFAPFPADLCRIPILATCPPNGVVIDPFCGTGTTLAVAKCLGRSAIGIDISRSYVELVRSRLADLLTELYICPLRLLERRQIFTDCLHLLTGHEPGNQLHIVSEIGIPGGNIDYILASVRAGKVRDFVGIELQTLDTTGTIWPERQDSYLRKA